MGKERPISDTNLKTNRIITWFGRIIVIVSTFGYFAFKNARLNSNAFFDLDGFIFMNYIIAVIYFLFIIINCITYQGWRLLRIDKTHFSLSVALICISAYTINLEFDVFHQFSLWCEVSLFGILIPLAIGEYYNKLPFALKWLYGAIVGFGLILSLYFTIYLIPVWGVGAIAIIILGLGIHFFTPAILLATLIVQYIKVRPTRKEMTGLLVGVVAPIVLIIYMASNWMAASNEINSAKKNIPKNGEFPTWYYLSRELDNDYFVNMVLEGDLAYSTPSNTDVGRFMGGRGGNTAYGDRFFHDPFIFTVALIGGEINIDQSTRFKLLEVGYAARHNTEEKLWTGRDLETAKIENNIEIFPEYRLAYNEKKITIHNGRKDRWRSQQEALYTFHLPEGAAMTSLSLWVEGVERKSRLTTKKKASGAYNNIVGVQMRDPAIAHWQEGNRVTVKVFPCTPEEDRVFKVGITSPLLKEGDELIYIDSYLQGPIIEGANEVSNVTISGKSDDLDLPFNFNELKEGVYQYAGAFNNDLIISMKAPNLSSKPFCFNGNCYNVKPSTSTKKFKQYDNIYLDINNSWDDEELEEIIALFRGKNIYVYDGKTTQITSPGDSAIYSIHNYNFNHIPLSAVDSANSLIITKNAGISPNMADLKKSLFTRNSKEFMANSEFIPDVYSLNYLNEYWSTLNQLQLINVQYGDIERLRDLVENHRFEEKSNSDSLVYIDNAEMMIVKSDTISKSQAPDHLLRLFGYNQLLKKIGRKYYNKEQYEDELLHIANKAFVLSPISSMVVLETDKDYDDHGIKKNKNSLANANMKHGAGSVPEPHEWALICLGGLMLIWFYRKRSFGDVEMRN